jgi:hypothetical protein
MVVEYFSTLVRYPRPQVRSTARQYVYGWKTANTCLGTYRQLVLKFKDGTSQPVNRKFTE